MRASQILGLVAMPLAAAMPAATNHYAHEAGGHLDTRVTLTDATQFQFEPFNLTNVGMECTRNTTEQMYSCELRCKYFRLSWRPNANTVTTVDWHDPNSVRENKVTTCSCISTWSWDGLTAASGEKNTYGTSYSMCYKQLPTYFEMRFATFNSSEDFSLEVAHHYKDSELVFVLA
jgi:hypothetical protein